MLNGKKAPSKISNILRMMNRLLIGVLIMQAIICITFAGLNVSWNSE